MHQIQEDVRQFVTDDFLFDSSSQFADDDSFIEKGLIDSMGILRLITFVEKKYAIRVLEEELITENWDSVERVAMFVQKKLGTTHAAAAN